MNKQFCFKYIQKSDLKQEILNLDVSKASQDSDIPTKIVKMNADIFAEVLYYVFNRSLEDEFPAVMKLANVTPVHRKVPDMIEVIIDLLAFCLIIKSL